jgi:hypothetical protein
LAVREHPRSIHADLDCRMVPFTGLPGTQMRDPEANWPRGFGPRDDRLESREPDSRLVEGE